MTLPLSLEELRHRFSAGESFKFIHFWGHRSTRDGTITNSCFSQWYAASFEIDGVRYPTAEHYMMASKARLFNDHAALVRILEASSPAAVKAAGREVLGFVDDVWVQHRFDIVRTASIAKFDQNVALREYLIGTGKRVLVEASPTDRIWGIGLTATDPAAINPMLWRGHNLLGFALMSARDALGVRC